MDSAASDAEIAYRLLLARGFLLEMDRGAIRLAGESQCQEGKDLDTFLRLIGIGRVEDETVRLDAAPSAKAFLPLFKVCGGSEELYIYDWDTWEWFVSHDPVERLPAMMNDPFISRLVKALLSCDIATCGSCDGNGGQRARVSMCGRSYGQWGNAVVELFVKPRLGLRFYIGGRQGSIVFFGRKDRLPELYDEIRAVADLLYDNRIMLRQALERVIAGIQCRDGVIGLIQEPQEVYELFRHELATLLKENEAG